MALMGFLSPDGTLHECDAWEHLDLAASIAAGERKFFKDRIEAEDYLFEQGYVEFGTRGASFRFKPYEGVHLSEKQRDFIEDNLSNANNDDQLKEMMELLRWDEDIRETSILSLAENKFLERL